MPRQISPVAKWSQYGLLLFVVGLVRVVGFRVSMAVAAFLAGIYIRLRAFHRDRVIRHVQLAFPEMGSEQVWQVGRRSCQKFAQLAVEMVFLPRRITKANYEQHLVRKNATETLAMFRARQPMVLVTGHFGNWEALGYFFSVEGHAIAATARPLDNPLINRWVRNVRAKHGMNVIEKWHDADSKILAALDNREAVGFIADQNGGPRGVFVPYFGRLASTPKTVGLLAMGRAVPVVCGYARRIEPRRMVYEAGTIDIIRPDDWADQDDPLFYITARYVRAIEQMVRAYPDEYLWMHRRWKSRPSFEQRGRPMPASLERKLRALPWMTEELMAELRKPPPA